ncbi:uncharacterized protein TRIADDRAFT_22466 [Trichoplax adhaerens]|uniref:NAD(+) diphosphatase n=1 Tax=Trichoplax adhaerens TaxID=10228 RepID=B3RRT5_TRIAD|nr:hypothetical protein TRIADDRAFT_22466 [Trichoplax adhaerens]EDV26926.1 hypothetical protein TRIADDRAFT_22466 [Trichoplax adhaerens]|eukprot:XP_002110922.1 hypothetical protein TRIADDRAFT_22466 [Trichoplax adhaerens]
MDEYFIIKSLHEAAKWGNLDKIKTLLSNNLSLKQRIDNPDDNGWTALMFAAKNNHGDVIEFLLENGAEPLLINQAGETAEDIAGQYKNLEICIAIRTCNKSKAKNDSINFFSHEPLQRCAERRNDKEWLECTMKTSDAKFILYNNLQPLVKENNDKTISIYRLLYSDVEDFIACGALVILLGSEKLIEENETGNNIWFGVNISHIGCGDLTTRFSGCKWLSKALPKQLMLVATDATIIGQGRSIFCWHRYNRFCSICGSSTRFKEAGYKLICSNEHCESHNGVHNVSYPRVDPVVIMLVISSDHNYCLLGRKIGFPDRMWSCLAGFMEPGETIDDAVKREVYEESGVIIDSVRYLSSQPWPFPSSLMIGCIAVAATRPDNTNLKIDRKELEDARWFTKEQANMALFPRHYKFVSDRIILPPSQAIAHKIIKNWLRIKPNL